MYFCIGRCSLSILKQDIASAKHQPSEMGQGRTDSTRMEPHETMLRAQSEASRHTRASLTQYKTLL